MIARAEQREAWRPHKLRVCLSLQEPDRQFEAVAYTRAIGHWGAFVDSSFVLPVGTVLQVTLDLPGDRQRFRAAATVARHHMGRAGAPDGGHRHYCGFEIRFHEALTPAAAAALGLHRDLHRTEDAPPRPAVCGHLQVLSVPAVLSLLAAEKQTGVLEVVGPRGDRASVSLKRGRVVHAQMATDDGPAGADLVFELATLREGEFEFRPGEVGETDTVQRATTQLLMQAALREDQRGSAA